MRLVAFLLLFQDRDFCFAKDVEESDIPPEPRNKIIFPEEKARAASDIFGIWKVFNKLLSYVEGKDIPPESALKLLTNEYLTNEKNESNEENEDPKIVRSECCHIIEGDIKGPIILNDDTHSKNVTELKLWPNATIPYYIEEKYFSKEQLEVIHGGIKYINENSCVSLRAYNKSADKDFVRITGKEKGGCLSELGRVVGGQEVNLETPKCIYQHWVIHELMHSVGFLHQHSAYNRDDYIKIIYENIEPGQEHNFQKYPKSMNTDFGVGYDYFSIMHYRTDVFSKNGEPTIKPLNESIVLKQSDNFTEKDIEKIRRMYRCS